MKGIKKFGLVIASAGVLAASLGACGSSDDQSAVNAKTDKWLSSQQGPKEKARAQHRNIAVPKAPVVKKVSLPPVKNCKANSFGMVTGVAVITNSTNDKQSYSITGEVVNSKGDRLAELDGFANNVLPGQKAKVQMLGDGDSLSGTLKCRVVSVDGF